jgi:lipopolysaccharide export system protein LptA
MLSPHAGVDIYQVPQKPQSSQKPQAPQQKGTPKIIEVVNSNELFKRTDSDIKVLKDSVVFLHDGAYLYCDSAYYNEEKNSFEAFSNVRMEQGDTLFLYGNYMHYEGNTKIVMFRENVRLEHGSGTLFTDSLNYDRMMNIGYYFDGGMLVDSLNELTSYWGQYEPNLKLATFKDSVILVNDKFTLYSDRLKYNTDTKIATIYTPTRIVSDSGIIYTSKGWYNTVTEESLLLDQSTIVNKEGNRILRGDSIAYHKAKGYGEVFGNMFLQDTTKRVILRGHYGFYNELSDYAMATDSAFCMEYSQGDTLYIHADTLKLIAIADSIKPVRNNPVRKPGTLTADSLANDSVYLPAADSLHNLHESILPVDSLSSPVGRKAEDSTVVATFRQIKAYYRVRFYRSDMQGICDSLQFNSKDSVLHMYKDPVLWNTNRQLYGDTIDIYMNDSTIDHMHVKRYSFSIEQKDTVHYNQLKSRSLKLYFANKTVNRVLAEGNVETIAYPEEKDKTLSGIMNWLESSYLEIFMKDGAFDKLVAWPKPVGKTTPFALITPDQLRLTEFYWYDYLRPLDKNDIFRKVSRRASDVKPQRSKTSIFNREEE